MLMSGKIITIGAIIIILIIGSIYLLLFIKTNKTREIIVNTNNVDSETINLDSLSWQEVKAKIPWEKRDSHEVLVYKDKIWLFGGVNGSDYVISPGVIGYNEAPHFSDVWVSDDGINWNLVTEKAGWGERRSIQAVVFKDKMWIIPGWGPRTGLKSEVWSSEDGKFWKLETGKAPWPAREGGQLVVFQNKIWLIGGVDYDKKETKNDVWYSEDGKEWQEANANAPWSPRWDHTVTVFQDKLWLIGGMDLRENVFADVWVSENGKDWSLVTNNPPWLARQGHETVVFKDKIWIIGRFNSKSQKGGKNDVWYSGDGKNWKKTKKDPLWEGREDHAAVVFKDKIWVLGGMTSDWKWKNDIWYSIFSH